MSMLSNQSTVDLCPMKRRLAGVKRGIFNPALPTLRHMERDDVMCKLPDDHCRNSTWCTAKQFADAYSRPFRLPERDLHCLSTVTGRGITSHYSTLEELQEAHRIWQSYLKEKPNLSGGFRENLATFCSHPNIDDWHFDGVMLRIIKPEIRDWRFTLKCEPGLDQSYRTQRLTPSDIRDRHRRGDTIYNY